MVKQHIKESGINLLGAALIGIGNWLFGWLVIRLSNPQELSLYNASIALFTLLALSGRFLTIAFTQHGWRLANFSSKFNLFGATMLLVILVLLGITAELPLPVIVLTSMWLLLNNLTAVGKGLLQYEGRFSTLLYIGSTEVVTKLVVLFLAYLFGYYLGGVWLGVLAQLTVGCYLSWLMASKYKKDVVEVQPNFAAIFPSLLFAAALVIATNIDQLAARWFLTEHLHATYVGITQLSKLYLFAALALLNVFLVTTRTSKTKVQLISVSSISTVALFLGGVFTLFITYFGHNWLAKTFEYDQLTVNLALLSVSGTILTLFAQIPATILLQRAPKYSNILNLLVIALQIILYLSVSRTSNIDYLVLMNFVTGSSYLLLSIAVFAYLVPWRRYFADS